MNRIILASASPRRRELLSQIGVNFDIRVSQAEEIYHSTVPQEIVKELALIKAETVARELSPEERNGCLLIGADTVVVQNGKILGKPKDEADALQMLRNLQGNCHEVYTGTALLRFENNEREVRNHAVMTKVYVHAMSEQEIRAYIATGEPMDKAGAYGIQGRFAAYIDRIEGDYYNVVGLPVSYIYQSLKELEMVF